MVQVKAPHGHQDHTPLEPEPWLQLILQPGLLGREFRVVLDPPTACSTPRPPLLGLVVRSNSSWVMRSSSISTPDRNLSANISLDAERETPVRTMFADILETGAFESK